MRRPRPRHLLEHLALLVAFVAGCPGATVVGSDADIAESDADADSGGDIDGGADSDVAADGDGDADADADSDADDDIEVPPSGPCAPLALPDEALTVRVATSAELVEAVRTAEPGFTLLLADGVYALNAAVVVTTRNLTVRSESGDRGAVVLEPGSVGFDVMADGFTAADLTIRGPSQHCLRVRGEADGGVDRFRAYNVVLADSGAQQLLVSNTDDGDPSRDGEVACSWIGYTSHGPSDSGNGVAIRRGEGWVLRDNRFSRLRGPAGGSAGPAILVWRGSRDTVIERNVLVDCYRSVALGNPSSGPDHHRGGVVRNNFITSALTSDTGIELAFATGFVVAYNTILLLGPTAAGTPISTFGEATGEVSFNLTNLPLGAGGVRARGNVTEADLSWFADPAEADLHLTEAAEPACDLGEPLLAVTHDIDGEPRADRPDVGADELY